MAKNQDNEDSKKVIFWSSSRFKIAAIILFGILLLIGGIVLGYFLIFKNPRKIISNMQQKMSQVRIIHHSTNLEIKSKIEGVDTKIDIVFEGDIDESNEKYPKYSLRVNTGGDFSMFSLNGELEARSLGSELYVKLNKVPNILALYGDSSNILNRWGKVSVSDRQGSNNNFGELLKDQNLFGEIQKLRSEKIVGVDTYHYKVTLSKEALSKLSLDQSVISVLTAQEVDGFKKFIDSLVSSPLEIWVGKRDGYLYKLAGSISEGSNEDMVTIKFSSILNNFKDRKSVV